MICRDGAGGLSPVTTWKAGGFEWDFPTRPLVMGILNVTPDSFSDGGRHLDPAWAVDRALELESEGADLIDIGGESTRPGAHPVEAAEELRRVLPVLRRLAGRVRVALSLDTRKSEVAAAGIAEGVSVINDVAALQGATGMWRTVASSGVGYVCMHMQGEPRTMQVAPAYRDVVGDVAGRLGMALKEMETHGLARERVVIDPGIGFGKTVDHNLRLLADLEGLHHLGRPILLGISRKSFLDFACGGAGCSERLGGSLAGAVWAAGHGVGILRVHDVAETLRAVRLVERLKALVPLGRTSGPVLEGMRS